MAIRSQAQRCDFETDWWDDFGVPGAKRHSLRVLLHFTRRARAVIFPSPDSDAITTPDMPEDYDGGHHSPAGTDSSEGALQHRHRDLVNFLDGVLQPSLAEPVQQHDLPCNHVSYSTVAGRIESQLRCVTVDDTINRL